MLTHTHIQLTHTCTDVHTHELTHALTLIHTVQHTPAHTCTHMQTHSRNERPTYTDLPSRCQHFLVEMLCI